MRKIKTSLLLGSLLTTTVSFAAFNVNSKDWPETTNNYYGNGQNTAFNKAVYGKGPITEQEHIEAARLIPQKNHNRFYSGLGVIVASHELNNFENTSTGALTGSALVDSKVSKDKMAYSLTGGYAAEQLRYEFEYLYLPKIIHSPVPVFSGGARAEQLASSVSGHSGLINIFYDFSDIVLFRPYVGAGVGGSYISTKSTLTNGVGTGVENTESSFGLAWNLTAGARIIFLHKFIVNFGYRYSNIGKVKWKDNVFMMESKQKLTGFNLNLAYLF